MSEILKLEENCKCWSDANWAIRSHATFC